MPTALTSPKRTVQITVGIPTVDFCLHAKNQLPVYTTLKNQRRGLY